MTEYTTDPEAIAHYLAARSRTAHWVDSLSGKTLAAPSFPPSLVSDTDDGLSSRDSDGESSHSLPPQMVLRYPDGRPDVPVSTDSRWAPHGQKPITPTPFHSRARAGSGSHGYPPSNPNIYSRAPSNAVPLYVSPPPPVVTTQPETIHVRPSPTSSIPQQGLVSYPPPDPYHNSTSASTPARQRSMRSTASSRPPPLSLQMIYTPPAPASLSRSAPVSPTHERFQAAQQPPPLPLPSAPHPPIAAPSPVYGFPSPTSAPEPPPPGPPTNSRTHSRTHSYSSNRSNPHPQAAAGTASSPPSSYPGTSSQRQRRHSSRTGMSHGHAEPQPQQPAPYTDSSHASTGVGGGPSFASGASGSGSRPRGPPSIVYAPSAKSSSYNYNPPLITSRAPQMPYGMSNDPHARAHAHAHARRMTPSISDPTPISASLGRNSSRGRMVEHLSRTPSPSTARAWANEASEASGATGSGVVKNDHRKRGSRGNSRRRDGNDRRGHRDDYKDEAASFSSGSTYYVLPSPGQKIKVVPPNTMNGLYAEPATASKSTPALQSHRSQNGPYYTGSAPPPPQPSRQQKRPFLQRIFHPHFGFGSGGASDPLSASRRGSRR